MISGAKSRVISCAGKVRKGLLSIWWQGLSVRRGIGALFGAKMFGAKNIRSIVLCRTVRVHVQRPFIDPFYRDSHTWLTEPSVVQYVKLRLSSWFPSLDNAFAALKVATGLAGCFTSFLGPGRIVELSGAISGYTAGTNQSAIPLFNSQGWR